jgi:hypothetical protein
MKGGSNKLLVRYQREGDDALEDELLAALEAAGVDLWDRTPSLNAFVNVDALTHLEWENGDLNVLTSVWSYPVRILPDEIRVYPPDERRRTE